MGSYIVITARDRSELYGYFRRQLAEDGEMQVLLDRRHGERRRRAERRAPERRRAERRSRGTDHGLYYHGFLLVRQSAPGSGILWRPPAWEGAPSVESRGGQPASGPPPARDARTRVASWVSEGQRLIGVLALLLGEHAQVTARADAAERKVVRLEEELRTLRGEVEHFQRERRQLAESLRALARQLVEAAGGPL